MPDQIRLVVSTIALLVAGWIGYGFGSARLEIARAQLAALDNTVKTRLPQVNALLQKQKLAPIKAEPLDPKADKDKPKSDRQ